MDINVNIKVGRVTRDAELTYTPTGMAIVNFSIAVNHRKTKDGKEDVSYFNCKAFGKLGENLNPYMKKGKQVVIHGFDKQERWEKDGQKNSRVIIYCEDIQLIGDRQQSEGSNGGYDNGGYEDNGYSYN